MLQGKRWFSKTVVSRWTVIFSVDRVLISWFFEFSLVTHARILSALKNIFVKRNKKYCISIYTKLIFAIHGVILLLMIGGKDSYSRSCNSNTYYDEAHLSLLTPMGSSLLIKIIKSRPINYSNTVTIGQIL